MKNKTVKIAIIALIFTLFFKVDYANAQPLDYCNICLECGDNAGCYSGYGLSYTNSGDCYCDPAGCGESCVPVNSKSWMLIPLGLGLVIVSLLFNKKRS
jgi:hypothetical protein